MLFLTADYNGVTAAAAGDDPSEDEIWHRSFHDLGGTELAFVEFGITASRELLVHTLSTTGTEQVRTIPTLSIRQVQ